MKHKSFPFLLFLILFSCTKENFRNTNFSKSSVASHVVIVDVDSLVPLNDLGAGTYMDSTGGLYPNGENTNSGTYADDLLAISQSIVPIDTFGIPGTSKLCWIAFLSLGGSTGGHNMKLLQTKTTGNPLTNPKIKMLGANQGKGLASLNSIMNPNDKYWQHVTQVLKGHRSSYRQVQIIYLETDDTTRDNSWPSHPNLIRNNLETTLRNVKQLFPNLKVVYVLARTKTFGVKQPWNMEPSPYYFGWGCKWAIQDQINGVPGTEYKGDNAVAPMLAWGFYQWADSLPRTTDNFYWKLSETTDGLHANTEGQDSLTTRFQNFLLTDPAASSWYANHDSVNFNKVHPANFIK